MSMTILKIVLIFISILALIKWILEVRINDALEKKKKSLRMKNVKMFNAFNGSFKIALIPLTTLTLAFMISPGLSLPKTKLNNINSVNNITNFTDIDEIINLRSNYNNDMDKRLEFAPLMESDSANEQMTDGNDSNKKSGAIAGDFTETNVQVKGVDEIDSVKTDGEYIYQVSNNNQEGAKIVISKAYPAEELSLHKEIFFNSNCLVENQYCNNEYINGVYVDEQYLVVILNQNTYYNYLYPNEDYNSPTIDESVETSIEPARAIVDSGFAPTGKMSYGASKSVIKVYRKDNFELADSYEFEGNLIDSRKIGENLFIVTAKNLDTNLEKGEILPTYKINSQEHTQNIADIYYPEDSNPNVFTSINGIDLKNKTVESKTILSGWTKLYMSNDNIYLVESTYKQIGTSSIAISPITKVAISNGNQLEVVAKGEVLGNPINQFSMDEYNGQFRIATQEGWGDNINNRLFVLNQNLTIINQLENLGKKGESLKSARFDQDYLYLVTFEQTDPFYVIDLKDEPKILGELEISGFSSYLHNLDSDHILGIGYEANEDGRRTGIKLAIYDVTDKVNPTEISKETFLYDEKISVDSTVLHNHKDLLFNPTLKIIGFPMNKMVYENNTYQSQTGYYLYSYEGYQLEEIGYIAVSNEGNYSNNRGLFLEQLLYVVSDTKITVFDYLTLEEIINLEL